MLERFRGKMWSAPPPPFLYMYIYISRKRTYKPAIITLLSSESNCIQPGILLSKKKEEGRGSRIVANHSAGP